MHARSLETRLFRREYYSLIDSTKVAFTRPRGWGWNRLRQRGWSTLIGHESTIRRDDRDSATGGTSGFSVALGELAELNAKGELIPGRKIETTNRRQRLGLTRRRAISHEQWTTCIHRQN
jgi:hypothetical protein